MNRSFKNVKVKTTFTEATTNANIVTGENISTSLGKIAKWYSDFDDVVWSGDASTVSGHTVAIDVPSTAKFTDTVYTHPTTAGNKHIPTGGSSGQILKWSASGTATWADEFSYTHPSYTARTGVPASNQTPAFGGTFTVSQPVSDATGHITAINSRTITIPKTTMTGATSDAAGAIGLVPAPAAGKQTSFLRGDGTWVVPTNTDTHYTSHLITGASNTATANAAATNGNVWLNALDNTTVRNAHNIVGTGATTVTSDANGKITINSTDTNTVTTATTTGSGNAVTAITASNGALTVTKGATFLTAHPTISKSTDTTSASTASHGGTITMVDSITRDTNGHVTKINTKTVTLPSDNNTDTKVTNTLTTTTKAYVTGTTSATTNTGTQVFDTGVYLDNTAGQLTATTFKGALTGNADSATKINHRVLSSTKTTTTGYIHIYTIEVTSAHGGLVSIIAVNDIENYFSGYFSLKIRNGTTATTKGHTYINWISRTANAPNLILTYEANESSVTYRVYMSVMGTYRTYTLGFVTRSITKATITEENTIVTDIEGTTAYTSIGVIADKLGSSTVGGAAKPIYLNAGTATACSSTVGSATTPVYMNAGTITACTYTLGKSVPSDAVFTDTVYTLPTASSSTLGGVKTTSTVTSSSGYTACPIISGVPYYKNTNTTYSVATTSANGLMSSTDKSKLDGITASADAVSFTQTLTSGTKVGTININGTDTILYAPTNTDTHYTSHLFVGASGGNANATTATSDPYLLCVDNTTNRNSVQLKAGSNMSISATSGVVTFDATDTKVTQTPVTAETDNDYPLLLAYSSNVTSGARTTYYPMLNSTAEGQSILAYNPSTCTLKSDAAPLNIYGVTASVKSTGNLDLKSTSSQVTITSPYGVIIDTGDYSTRVNGALTVYDNISATGTIRAANIITGTVSTTLSSATTLTYSSLNSSALGFIPTANTSVVASLRQSGTAPSAIYYNLETRTYNGTIYFIITYGATAQTSVPAGTYYIDYIITNNS